VQADDCLLLARLSVPVIEVDDHWEVQGAPAAVLVDEADRPLLLAASLAQSAIGNTLVTAARTLKLALITAAGTIPADSTLVIIRSDSAIDVKVPGSTLTNSGTKITIRSASDVDVKLTTPATTTIDNKNDFPLVNRTSVTLISDGTNKNWTIASRA